MIDLKHKSILMYVVLKQKSVFLAIEMRLTSLALKFKLSEFKVSRFYYMSFVLCDIKFNLFFVMSDQNFVLSTNIVS